MNSGSATLDRGVSSITRIKFVNSSSWLSATSTPQPIPTLGTGSYTLECFLRIKQSYSNPSQLGIFGIGSSTSGYSMSIVNGKLSLLNGSTTMYSDIHNFPADDRWRHCAITRNSSGLVQIWINGKSKISFNESPIVQLNNTNDIAIGRSYNNVNNHYLPVDSEISNLRISRINRYTNDFTPSFATSYIVDTNDILVCEFRFSQILTSGAMQYVQLTNNNSVNLVYF
jgi:hypothetical protein